MTEGPEPRVIVRTPDRREYRGRLVVVRKLPDGREMAVVRLDTGWVTSYPKSMVHIDPSER